MKQITSNGKDWLFVPIPEGTTVELSTDGKVLAYQIIPMTAFNDPTWHIDLPQGQWQLHATTDNITEEKADMIVGRVVKQDGTLVGYQDHEERFTLPVFKTALDSFPTFLTHHNLTGRYAILRKL
jgi:hypothetical protein